MSERRYHRFQFIPHARSDLCQQLVFDRLHRGDRIDRSDFEHFGSNLLDNDVAGQHGSDLVLGLQCLVRQAWIVRAKDTVRPEVRADFFL